MQRFRVPLHDNGPALWPEYQGVLELEKAHRQLGTAIFDASYQLQPGGLTGQIINPAWFAYGYVPNPEDVPTTPYMTVDPAISTKSSADETAMAVGNISASGQVWLRWVWHGRVGLMDQVRIIHEAWQHYHPVAIGVEAVAYQSALIQDLEARFDYLPLEPITPDRDKTSRFYALGALYEFGQIIHHPTIKGSATEWQLTRLPASKHDDIADAISMLTLMQGSGSAQMTYRRPGAWRGR